MQKYVQLLDFYFGFAEQALIILRRIFNNQGVKIFTAYMVGGVIIKVASRQYFTSQPLF